LFKKNVSAILLFLLLVSTLTVAFNIQRVKAEGGTIYIRADGSVDPPQIPASNTPQKAKTSVRIPLHLTVIPQKNETNSISSVFLRGGEWGN